MNCKVCNSKVDYVFNKQVLFKYSVKYYQCSKCGFMQTETPYWLEEAYEAPISNLDTGILSRNISNVAVTSKLITHFFNSSDTFLDFGGGYGTFTRMMRDVGFDFRNYDKYCDNVFSKNYSVDVLDEKFELLTAFELFEHVEQPLEKMKELLKYSDNIFISTTLQPSDKKSLKNWEYLVPEAGQHISLYSLESLKVIGKTLDLNLLSNGSNYHLFTKVKKKNILFRLICSVRTNKYLPLRNKLQSLTLIDYQSLLSQLKD